MNKTAKWIVFIVGVLVISIILVIIIAPLVINVEKYKPQIEAKVSEVTGRSFELGGPLKPSVFPWIGLQLKDLHLGNPSGFQEKDFVSVTSFEVRVKLLPLLSRQIEVKRFVMANPRIVLEVSIDGRASWKGLGPQKTTSPAQAEEGSAPKTSGDSSLPIKGLMVEEFAITNGQILYIDQSTQTRKEIKDINLILSDVALNNPIGIAFSAIADGNSIALDGTLGPLGETPGKAPLPLDLVLKVAETLNIKLNGNIDNSGQTPQFDLALDIAPFSPRKLLAQLQQPLPIAPADNSVLNSAALALSVNGSPENIKISKGRMKLDDTQITFNAQAKALEKPDVMLKVNIDQIDLDRYLPEAKDDKEEAPNSQTPERTTPPDYAPLRKLVLDARLLIGKCKVKNLRLQEIALTATAKNGIIAMNPLKLKLYKGHLSGTGKVDVRKTTPRGNVEMALNSIQAGPLLNDFLNKEIIEGALTANTGLNFKGDQPAEIRRTLNGQGKLTFKDGAIVGIDLANMVRNVKSTFGGGQKSTQKPRTDFAELVAPFTIAKGLFKTNATKMSSPLLRLQVSGTADLASEKLDLRIEPKVVATIKGQGDTQKRSGLAVPILVSGNFSKPKFAPDLKGMLGQKLGQPIPDKKALKKMLPSEKKVKKQVEEKAKGLLKGLPLGKE